jgi:hypothetical protein
MSTNNLKTLYFSLEFEQNGRGNELLDRPIVWTHQLLIFSLACEDFVRSLRGGAFAASARKRPCLHCILLYKASSRALDETFIDATETDCNNGGSRISASRIVLVSSEPISKVRTIQLVSHSAWNEPPISHLPLPQPRSQFQAHRCHLFVFCVDRISIRH